MLKLKYLVVNLRKLYYNSRTNELNPTAKIALNFDKEIVKHTNIYSDLSLNLSYENKKNNRLIKPIYSIESRLNIWIKYIQ